MKYQEYSDFSKEQIAVEIIRLKRLKSEKHNEELAIKDVINSMYGATSNEWFSLYDINISEAITLQGQDIIKYSEHLVNDYFMNQWHLDKDLHQQMGLNVVRKVNKEPVRYIDTDSNYVTFEDMLASCDWEGTEKDFILTFNKLRFAEYLDEEFKKYSSERNTKSYLNFELESISASTIFVAKKKYAYDLVWKDPGISFEPQSKLSFKGLDIIQSSYPKFAREKLKELCKLIFREKNNLNVRKFIARIKEIKEEFKLQDVDNIAMNMRVNNYEKYILNDTTRFEIASKCGQHVRAAGYYNFTVNNSKVKMKYPLIKSGDKTKVYFSQDLSNDVFGFLPNQFPYEIAPPVDYDAQFNKVLVDPINRLLEVVVNVKIPGNLSVSKKLF